MMMRRRRPRLAGATARNPGDLKIAQVGGGGTGAVPGGGGGLGKRAFLLALGKSVFLSSDCCQHIRSC